MQFSNLAILFSLSVATLAAPIDTVKRATTKATSASVLTAGDYSTFQVSDGVAGDALAEVNAKFPIDTSNFAGVSAADLAIITKAAQISEDAEVGTGGFNDAIDAAGGTSSTAGAALQVGKIKNKVLKLQTDVLRIQIQTAQGNAGSSSELAAQQKKLATNVALDVAQAGKTSKSISFSGTD
ncbi:uncharacterized protein EAE98_009938 [Botrytis deweyae]|uniref:Small secreted protein n=1 Tax=Botrytis deweyae TaxID=2478750 RepID=A0ABQ7I9Y2_9HELO|nr:uncharacterized protein EAE98_009938 [Botrytis deweyae]KAF7917910.1 hypothetical protein EAE98_009938 [Botrytis deweyae]KAF7919821.1 hypothetical protein EAE99_008366 [Botrytis elliptica]